MVSKLKDHIDSILGVGAWAELETETILSELGLPVTSLLFDQVSLLKAIESDKELFFKEALFFMYAVAVFNDEEADFGNLPSITSLEIALAIVEMAIILDTSINELPVFEAGPKAVVRDILIEEGYSKSIAPFDIVGVGELTEGQTEQDTKDKEMAIRGYIHAIYNK